MFGPFVLGPFFFVEGLDPIYIFYKRALGQQSFPLSILLSFLRFGEALYILQATHLCVGGGLLAMVTLCYGISSLYNLLVLSPNIIRAKKPLKICQLYHDGMRIFFNDNNEQICLIMFVTQGTLLPFSVGISFISIRLRSQVVPHIWILFVSATLLTFLGIHIMMDRVALAYEISASRLMEEKRLYGMMYHGRYLRYLVRRAKATVPTGMYTGFLSYRLFRNQVQTKSTYPFTVFNYVVTALLWK